VLGKIKDVFEKVTSQNSTPSTSEDEACLVNILEIYADTASESEKLPKAAIKTRVLKWREHLLKGIDFAERNGPVLEKGRKDFSTLQKWFRQIRELEAKNFALEIKDLRILLSNIFDRFSYLSQSEDKDTSAISQEVLKLRRSLEAKSLEEMKSSVLTSVVQFDSLVKSRTTFKTHLLQQMDEEIKSLKKQVSQLQTEILRDSLTQLFNRKSLDSRLQEISQASKNQGKIYACLFMIDIDHFKKINDTYGHQIGDVALKLVADASVRVFSKKTDFVARYGGEEICIVSEVQDREVCRIQGKKLLEEFRAIEVPFAKGTFKLTATIGLAFLEKSETTEMWLKRADESLYLGKSLGRDRLVEAAGSVSSGRVA
jgi:diguanylate cyclase